LCFFKQITAWKEHLFNLERDLKISPIQYVIYQDQTKQWRIQCVPSGEQSFASRKSLPEPWRGVRDEELSRISGIPGCVFTHASGFIGGNLTYEGVLAMAIKALATEEMPVAKRAKVE